MSPTRWLTEAAWLGGPELTHEVVIEVDGDTITDVSTETRAGDIPLPGLALPGLANAHSHAFHRLLRGRTHERGGDFWVWREAMYEVAGALTPEDYERVATAVYVEMAMAGITTVGEFHYLHHQTDGRPYGDPNEMSHALIRAARRAGIRIALLDAGYFSAGFDGGDLDPVQRRFSDGNVKAWLERVAALADHYRGARDVVVGVAPHSVRAVPEAGLRELAEHRPEGSPLHIHVSEQPKENEDCEAATGATPVGLLGRSGLLGPDTTLIHATHLTGDDIAEIGRARSSVCYCATTERDLADGLGPAADLAAAGASLCVGTDSHAVIDVFEEARGMELHQRLATGHRGLISPAHLAEAATVGGARALGFPGTGIEVGGRADFITLDVESPRLTGAAGTIAEVVFAATAADVVDVFVAGRRIVDRGRHREWPGAREALGGAR